MSIIQVTQSNARLWAELCNELWPCHSVDEMLAGYQDGKYPHEYLTVENNNPVAFISLSVRHEYVEGKIDANPVGYLEGIYVKPDYRRRGIAGELVQFAKKWSLERGCTMLASDCDLTNEESRLFHRTIGFDEVSINVHFTMPLTD